METRVLTEADVEAYYRIRLRALREHPDVFGRAVEEMQSVGELCEEFRQRHNGQASFILGAFDPELVGIVACSRERGMKREHVALIWGMYVVPEARRRGIGRRLVQDVIARARVWPGLDQLWLSVVTDNTAARALYRLCGFEPFGVQRRALKVGDRYLDEEHMALYLAVAGSS